MNKFKLLIERKIFFKDSLKNQSGQTLLEFMFVLLTIVLMAAIIRNTSSSAIAKLWKTMVETVAETNVQIR